MLAADSEPSMGGKPPTLHLQPAAAPATNNKEFSMDSQITTVVADDHPAILDSVSRFLVSEGVAVVASCGSGQQALLEIEKRRPKTALVDAQMPGVGGIEVVRRAARTVPETAMLVYTGFCDGALLTEALDAGAAGLVLKEAPLHDLTRALKIAAEGGTYIDPALAGSLFGPGAAVGPALSRRELEVIRLLSNGRTNEAMASELFLSPETVRTYVRKAMGKLEADTRTHAVAKAFRLSLIV
jgi:DNA-binding NarL/FixJ family response regulator